MSSQVFKRWSRRFVLLGGMALGLTQVGCAHPLVVEPSVTVSSRIGHFPVYGQVGLPAHTVLMPAPHSIYAPPPRVIYAPPPVYRSAPVWGHVQPPRHAWGHDRREARHSDRSDRRDDRRDGGRDGGRGQAGRGDRDGWNR